MIILMDSLGYCEEVGIRCDLDWRPRDVNVEADELANGIFHVLRHEETCAFGVEGFAPPNDGVVDEVF